MNKKGFVLTETLMVTVFIVVIFTFVYTAVIPLIGIYRDKADRENNIDIAYKLYHLRKMIKQDENGADIIQSDLRRVDCVDLVNQEYCSNLMHYLDLNQYDLIFTKSIAENFEDIKGINKEVEEYIKPYEESNVPCLILLDKEKHTIVHLNYDNINVMGTFSDTIINRRQNITEIYFKKEPTITINAKYREIDSSLKTDITYDNQGRVLAWLEDDPNNAGKYILYIESNDITYLHEGSELFAYFNNLKKIDFGNANTKMVTDMTHMFRGCLNLTNLDLRIFNTSNVESFELMFLDCKNLVSIDVSSFYTPKAKRMVGMFNGCEKLTSLNLSNFNTSNVIDMDLMFALCKSLENLNINSFDTKNVETMEGMFNGCEKLTSLNLSNFNTTKVKNMSNMFEECKELAYLNVSSFNTSLVENMRNMFSGDRKLTVLNLSNFNTSKVIDMSGMFRKCESLIVLNLSSFKTSNVNNMSYMFSECYEIETIYVSNLWTTGAVTNSSNMFYYNNAIVGGNGTRWNDDNPIDKTYARIDSSGNPGYFTLWT